MKKAVAAGMITLFAGAGLVATGTSASAAPVTHHQAIVRDDHHGDHWGDHRWGDDHWGHGWGWGWGDHHNWGDHHGDHHNWGDHEH